MKDSSFLKKKFIILDTFTTYGSVNLCTKFIILNTKIITLNTKIIILNTKIIILHTKLA